MKINVKHYWSKTGGSNYVSDKEQIITEIFIAIVFGSICIFCAVNKLWLFVIFLGPIVLFCILASIKSIYFDYKALAHLQVQPDMQTSKQANKQTSKQANKQTQVFNGT